MVVVTVKLGQGALADFRGWLILLASLLAVFRWQVGSVWLVLGGAIVGRGLWILPF